MAADERTARVDREERAALARAAREAPEQDPSLAVFGRDVDADVGQGGATMPEDSTAQDWRVADAARPDFEDETGDGLGTYDEAVRHAAEDPPADEPWEERVRRKAHEIWLSEGGPHGRAEDHWRIAKALVAEEIASGRADLPYAGREDEPTEEAGLQRNLGEFPTLTDQGEEATQPSDDAADAAGNGARR